MTVLQNIVYANGIYDIICAISILAPYDVPIFSTIHTNMFINKSFNKSCLAYWIFTYGFMRLYSMETAFYSYIIEALFFTLELHNNNVHVDKSLFVILSSLFLAYWILFTL